jgi:hypothetical protein
MTPVPSRRTYFLFAHLILCSVVFLAFAPTYFLRSLVPQPPILDLPTLPSLFHVHGVILFAWYAFLVVQPILVRSGSLAVHRRAGWWGVGLAVAALVSTVAMVLRFPKRMHALAVESGTSVEALEPGLHDILWLDVFMCLLFVGYVTTGVLARKRPQVHARCMFFAGISLVFAATARLGGITSFVSGLDVAMLVNFGILLGLTVSLPIHDRRALGRVLPVSWVCFAAYWAGVALSVVCAGADTDQRLIGALLAW